MTYLAHSLIRLSNPSINSPITDVDYPTSFLWVATTHSSSNSSNVMLYSSDQGASWSTASFPEGTTNIMSPVAFGNPSGSPRFVAGSNDGGRLIYSSNGTSWANTLQLTQSSTINYNPSFGYFTSVHVSPSANTIRVSSNGIDWSTVTLPVGGNWWRSAYGAGTTVLIAIGGQVAYSRNGTSWGFSSLSGSGGNYWESVAYGNSKFIALSSGNRKISTSTDFGKTWTYSGLTGLNEATWVNTLNSIAYGNGIWVATGTYFETNQLYRYATSTDGVTWTQRTMPFISSDTSQYGTGGFTMYVENAFIHTRASIDSSPVPQGWWKSTDGLNWTNISIPVRTGSRATVTFGTDTQAVFPLLVTTFVPSISVIQGENIGSVAPVVGEYGLTSHSYAISPSLPAGLNFNTSTGELTGAPTETLSQTTFTVTVSDGRSVSKSSSFNLTVDPFVAPIAPTSIGQSYQGGTYAGNISVGNLKYYLIISPKATGDTLLAWKNADTLGPANTYTLNDGYMATAAMVAEANSTVYPAAHFCWNLSIGGYDDWYMPSRDELEICYRAFKPTTENNSTGSRLDTFIVYPEGDGGSNLQGENLTSIPNGDPYTLSNPSQTSIESFRSPDGSERLGTDANGASYISSSQESASSVWFQWVFGGEAGKQVITSKSLARRVRAVRRVRYE